MPPAAVIPRFLKVLKNHEAPVINGDGTYSRDFTYIDNVLQVNHLAALTTNRESINQIYNVAHGERTDLNQLFELIREMAGRFDRDVLKIEPIHGPERAGDIPHSLASVDKARILLGYSPTHNIREGLSEAVKWYWENL